MMMDEQSKAAKVMESGLELLQLLPALPFEWEGPSATMRQGGILCMVLSRVELASLDLAHLQLFPSNTSTAFLDAVITSSTQMSSYCTNILPVFKTKAVLDVEQAQSSEIASLLRARSSCRSTIKVMSMDEIGLNDHRSGRSRYPELQELDKWEMKQPLDGTGMIPKETKSSPILEAKHHWEGTDEAKFLLHVMPWELAPLTPLMPFKTSAAVPFKWEDVPGKPKPVAVAPGPNIPRLQLPPRLYTRPIHVSLPNNDRHSKAKHIFHYILPWRRPGKATKSSVQEWDDNTLSAGANSQLEALSPLSILQGFDTQSQASSTSPDICPTSDNRLKDLACTAYREFSFRGISGDPPSSSRSNFITASCSPFKNFGTVHETKGFRHLHSAVEKIKEAVRSWKGSKILGRRKDRSSVDFDGAEVWSPKLARHYQRSEHETEFSDELQYNWKDQNMDGDEATRFDNKFEQPPKKFSADQTIGSPRWSISDSIAATTHPTGSLSRRNKRSLRKWIVYKMQRSYFFVRRNLCKYIRSHSK